MADDAPLIETDDIKAPPGGEAAWYAGAGHARLRAALFTPPGSGRPRGSIVLSGGRTESIEKYYEFIGECLERGFVVLAHDWRGQGLSRRDLTDPLKGHAKGFKPYLDDFRLLLSAYEDRLPRPWVGVAHSMGACLTLLAMAQGETRFAGAIFSAPMLGVKTPFPLVVSRVLTSLNLMVGRGSVYTLGGAGKPYDSTFETNVLTHDPVRHARAWSLIAAEPKLALGAPTWGWVDFCLRATAWLARPEALRNVTVPVVIVSAEEDQLIDTATQAAAARHLPQGKFITVPGAYHEILMETDPMRNIFLRAFDALTGRVAPTPASAPKAAPATPPAPTPAAVAAAPVAPTPAPAAKPAPASKPAAKKVSAPKAAAKPAAAKAAAPKTAAKPAAKPAAAKPAAAKPAAAKAAAPVKAPPAKASTKPAAAKKPTAVKAAAPAKKPASKPAVAKAATAAKTTVAAKKAPAKPAPAKPAAVKKPAVAKTPAPAKAPAAAKAAAPKTAPAPKKAAAPKKAPAKKAPAKKAPAKKA
jgi:alpha-beta hydrolase superfamily lysophospholipase